MSEAPYRLRIPKRLLSFDIETEMIEDRKHLEDTPVLFAGWQVYEYSPEAKWYAPAGDFQWLPEAKFGDKVNNLLNDFDGLVIGHNLFNFDYQVMWKYGSLEKALPKTCDTYALLKLVYRGKGLKLDKLGANFGEHKTCSAEEAIAYYKNPRTRRLALEYNAQDCALEAKLWMHLLQQQSIQVIDKNEEPQQIKLNLPMLEMLVCAKPQMTADRYLREYPHLDERNFGIG